MHITVEVEAIITMADTTATMKAITAAMIIEAAADTATMSILDQVIITATMEAMQRFSLIMMRLPSLGALLVFIAVSLPVH